MRSFVIPQSAQGPCAPLLDRINVLNKEHIFKLKCGSQCDHKMHFSTGSCSPRLVTKGVSLLRWVTNRTLLQPKSCSWSAHVGSGWRRDALLLTLSCRDPTLPWVAPGTAPSRGLAPSRERGTLGPLWSSHLQNTCGGAQDGRRLAEPLVQSQKR